MHIEVSYEEQKRHRIRASLFAFAYEFKGESLISDAEFDSLCLKIDPSISTDNAVMDVFFRRHFEPTQECGYASILNLRRLKSYIRELKEYFMYAKLGPNKEVIEVSSTTDCDWGDPNRIISQEMYKGCHISTVFTPVSQINWDTEEEVHFETMVFSGPIGIDEICIRGKTYQEAMENHEKAKKEVDRILNERV